MFVFVYRQEFLSWRRFFKKGVIRMVNRNFLWGFFLLFLVSVAIVFVVDVLPRILPRLRQPKDPRGLGFSFDLSIDSWTRREEGEWSKWRINYSLNNFDGTSCSTWKRTRIVSYFSQETGEFLFSVVEAEEKTFIEKTSPLFPCLSR